ncbi:MAG: type II toxin-antitoxin system RelE/ParE family toxin [Lentisphaerae bacterium]|nr:type II toxin-antitoxin system RelE/ParE family toxin [Lentisphaerota bacterium]
MKVQVLEDAVADLADGFRFYERQVEGLGDFFLDSLWSDIHSLRLYAGVHSVHHGYHRLLSKRVPFAVYYRVENGTARVRAVLDCRRDPNRIANRLS